MTYKLFLDDIRQPPDDTWVIARSYEEGVNIVQERGFPSVVSFDHDLGKWDEKTGKDFANFLIDYDLDHNIITGDFKFVVHSANPAGAANIQSIMDGYLRFKKR